MWVKIKESKRWPFHQNAFDMHHFAAKTKYETIAPQFYDNPRAHHSKVSFPIKYKSNFNISSRFWMSDPIPEIAKSARCQKISSAVLYDLALWLSKFYRIFSWCPACADDNLQSFLAPSRGFLSYVFLTSSLFSAFSISSRSRFFCSYTSI